uniref:Endonuclease V n=1 Tax=Chenopodium quinoa TaxID=63459 RepID=A0A803MF21_CHEQI
MEQSSSSSSHHQHNWIEIQDELKKKLIKEDDFSWEIPSSSVELEMGDNRERKEVLKYVGGVDISFLKEDPSFACGTLVVLELDSLNVVYDDFSVAELHIPYVPGFLAFREAPILLKLLDKMKENAHPFYPQLLMIDGNGILHPRGSGNPLLGGYTDVDMAGDLDNKKSTSGSFKSLGLKQGEYLMLCDSQSAMDLSKNAMYHACTKHIDVEYHWLRDVIEERHLNLKKVHTDKNAADMLTKVVLQNKLDVCSNFAAEGKIFILKCYFIGFGLACHLGVMADLPTIGIGKNLHHVEGLKHSEVRDLFKTGDYNESVYMNGNSGQTLGVVNMSFVEAALIYGAGQAMRSTLGALKPIYISIGHRISLTTSMKVVKLTCKYRVPEPIRQFDLGELEIEGFGNKGKEMLLGWESREERESAAVGPRRH